MSHWMNKMMAFYRGRSEVQLEYFMCEKAINGRLYRMPYHAVVELVKGIASCHGAEETWRWYRGEDSMPDVCKTDWNPDDTSWITAFLGTDHEWICNWLDEVLNENYDHPIQFNYYVFTQDGRTDNAAKICTDACKLMIYNHCHRYQKYVSGSPYYNLVHRGPDIWKRLTKTTLAKYKTTEFQFNLHQDALELFVGLDQAHRGWCHFTAAELDDPKIIIREFGLTDCNDGRLYGAVVVTDPADKQFLGVAWVFDTAP